MVLNFEDLNIITDNIVEYFTGSYQLVAVLLCCIFLIILLSRDLDIRYALTFTLPLLGFFIAIGWFGTVTNNEWIINLALIVVSLIYGTVIVKLST